MIAVAWAAALCAALPLLIVSIECLAGLRPGRSPSRTADAPPFVVLVPAHDEAAGIAATIAAIRRQLRACDRLLVVADNCVDATADVALRAGAAVVRRNDPGRRGKGYALAFGRDILRNDPPAAVIVIDADCVPEPGALQALARSVARRGASVQGRYLLSAAPSATAIVRISSFAFLIKNLVRQRGLDRLGGMALLQGAGMAFPWRIFDTAPLATPSLVEDLKLGLDLVLAGEDVRFEDDARFTSRAGAQAATRPQRTRWEHGMLATAAVYLPRLLVAGIRRPRLLLLAADLLVPPLALLVEFVAVITLALLLSAVIAGDGAPLALLLAVELLFAATLVLTWRAHGRALLPPAALLRLPHYILWKQPIYARLLGRREQRWIRTSRAP
ncbi:glycosyltransferase family 2 protein [Sphingomonas sp. SUN019]|uniref:glycosyltransferase family 2 protein n=1 Tax=Sphingomonas sp. SUN019 TaxID=2937788 RepID=UPI0021646A68|nr:glycosyltransferase family 2 protein [Sphingomonas sp. SUN019]UVO51481.1 glycosyltransferase family 2 protein [Sphingomonas sp. SUN019]